MALGLVLAGGRSSRFGRDKALAVLGGRSLLQGAVETLGDATAVAVAAPQGSAAEVAAHRLQLPVLSDRPDGAHGPLAGVLAGLDWALGRGAEWMISLPCDAVLIPPGAFRRLLAAALKANGAYAVTSDGPQSLCAVWPVGCRAALEAALKSGTHPPVNAFLELMGASPVHFDGTGIFLNINTPDDLRNAETWLFA